MIVLLDDLGALNDVTCLPIVVELQQVSVIGVHHLLLFPLLFRFHREQIPVVFIDPEGPFADGCLDLPLLESHDALEDVLG